MPDVSDGCPLEAWKSGDPQDKRAKAEFKKACAKAAKEGKPRPPAPLQPPAAGEHDAKPQVNDGWNRKKVRADVMDAGRILSFSEAEMAEWRALFDFWEQHPTPESLPASPHTIQMDDGRSYKMIGPPAWAELWRVLRRFPRPHHQTQAPQPPQPQLAAGDGTHLAVCSRWCQTAAERSWRCSRWWQPAAERSWR